MQQRIVAGHRQFGVGEGQLGVVLGRRGRDEIGGQITRFMLIRVRRNRRQGTDVIGRLQRVILAAILRVAVQL